MNLHLTLHDIARLAEVERPTVSTWRKRSGESEHPFPAPVATLHGQERFDVDAVIEWLTDTGRATGRDLRGDAAAHASPSGVSFADDTAALAGLTALLALKAITETAFDGRAGATMHFIARTTDPDDALLLREITDLGESLDVMVAYADQLIDAAYGTQPALEQLLALRFRRNATDLAAGALAAPMHSLVVALARGLALLLDDDSPAYLDPTGAGNDLLLSVIDALGDPPPEVLVAPSDTPAARLFRRRAATRKLLLSPAPPAIAEAGPAVIVAQYPVPGQDDSSTQTVLESLLNLADSMSEDQRAVVVAPAAALIDSLADEPSRRARQEILRTGRVRASVKLAAGLVTQSPRQALGLWILGPEPEKAALDERRIAVGHLDLARMDDSAITEVIDDVLTAASAFHGTHRYSRLSPRRTYALLGSEGSLLPVERAGDADVVSPAEVALRVERLRRPFTLPDALDHVAVDVRAQASKSDSQTLGGAVHEGALRMISGNRDGFALTANGSVVVLGVPELLGEAAIGSRRVERLEFLGAHPVSRLTEPGDVVFCTAPRPSAVVDSAGGSAVQYPARSLRVSPVRGERFSPDVIAQTISAQPPGSREWKRWDVPLLPPDQVMPVNAALAALDKQKRALRARLADLDALQEVVAGGVSRRAVTLSVHEPHQPRTTKEP